jgi:acyl carrier protein
MVSSAADEVLSNALLEVGVQPAALARDRPLDALGLDSFDLLRVLDLVEDGLEITVETQSLRGVRTVGELIDVIARCAA